MLYDRPGLKLSSKKLMATTKPSVYLITILFILFSIVIYNLGLRLTGADVTLNALAEMANKLNTSPNAVLPTTQELAAILPAPGFFASLLALVMGVIYAFLEVGYTYYCLKIRRHEKTTYKDLLSGFENFGRVLALLVVQVIFIFLWSLLLIIPGIIAAYRYSMALYVLYDHPDWGPVQCLKESSRLIRGAKMSLFILQVSFIGWYLVDSLVTSATASLLRIGLPLVSIFLMPYMQITTAGFYDILLIRDGQTPPSGDTPPEMPPL